MNSHSGRVAHINLDVPPIATKPHPLRVRRVLVGAAILTLVLGISALAATASPYIPTLLLRAEWLPGSDRVPTAVAWYRDGSREDITSRLAEEWVADRPLRLITVSAEVACEIWVDDRLGSSDRSARGRYAVCAWMAA